MDRFDPRSDDRDRGDSWDRNVGSRGGADGRERDERARDVFTRDLDLPYGQDREQVRDRDRVYEIDGDESRALATVGAFRVVSESDLHDTRQDSQRSPRSLKHLEHEGLIRTSPLSADDRWTLDFAHVERLEAIAAFGFTERQARFLVTVLLHAGVFVERQYCRFAGTVHGQKSTDFLKTLVSRRFATPVATGKLHRGRMFHVHYKPLWAAIGEPDTRFRKPTAPGRMIERVMLLDAVLDARDVVWLGPAIDKRRHFMRHLEDRLGTGEFPHLRFGNGPAKTVRSFPDKLPIGVLPGLDSHVFVYLVTRPSPMDFRRFLLRHTALLRVLFRWTVRLLFPRQLSKARGAYVHAAREHLATPLDPSVVETLEGLLPERKRLVDPVAAPADDRYLMASSAYRLPRFRALYQQWLDDPQNTLWMAGSPILAEAIDREHGRVECVELSRQYLHLSPLVDVA